MRFVGYELTHLDEFVVRKVTSGTPWYTHHPLVLSTLIINF